jgi:hypothetical protein
MVLSEQRHAFGVFSNHQETEQALNELKNSGFLMEKVSIIAKQTEQDEQLAGTQVSNHIGEQDIQSSTGVALDVVTGSLWGTVLVGLGSLAIPGIGPVIALGSLGLGLVTSAAGIGLEALQSGNLIKALVNLGIAEEQARGYNDRLLRGSYLVIVEGTDEEISRAEAIFSNQGIQDWSVHNFSQA